MIAFSSLIFIIFFAALQDRIVTTTTKQANIDLARLGNMVYAEVSTAERFGNGYSREFFLPPEINGLRYNVSILNNSIMIVNSSIGRTYYFFNNQVIGQPTNGSNTLFSIAGTTYINQNISKVLNIRIDGSNDDWEALQAWYGILSETDIEGDAFVPRGNPVFDYDLKDFMIWNDDEWLYFRFEIYSDKIFDYTNVLDETNYVDFILLIDTDLDSSTGYYNTDETKVYSELGAEYAIFDAWSRIEGKDFLFIWEKDNPWPSYNITRRNPFTFDGSLQSEFKWTPAVIGAPNGVLAYIGDSAIEMSIKLTELGLNVGDEPLISYNLLSRKNETLVTDYIPGESDTMRVGYYQLQNR